MILKILRGTILGGIAYFLIGWLVWGLLLMDFFSTRMNQCLNRPEGEMIWWAIIASNLVYALLLTLILNWSGAKKWIDGLKTGALVGLLFACTVDLSFWSMNTLFNDFGTLVLDVVAGTVVASVIGLIIVLTWGKGKAD